MNRNLTRLVLAAVVVSGTITLLTTGGPTRPAFARATGTIEQSQGSPTAVQQSASRADAATRCDSAAGTGTVTLTLQNPGPSLSDYVTFVILNGELTGAVTPAAPVAFTTTGFNGTSPTLGSIQLLAGANGTVVGPGFIPFPTPLKGNTNTAPTIALVGITNQSTRMTACYYIGA
jgi:hypothetical protein